MLIIRIGNTGNYQYHHFSDNLEGFEGCGFPLESEHNKGGSICSPLYPMLLSRQ